MDNNDNNNSFLIVLFAILITIAIKATVIVVIPAYLISQVLNYYGLDSNTVVISKVIVALWLMSFMIKKVNLNERQ